MKKTIAINGYQTHKQTLFTAQSYLVDRIVPAVEEISLPPVAFKNGSLSLSVENQKKLTSSIDDSKLRRLKAKLKNQLRPRVIADRLIVDFRFRSVGNWAHALNVHIPLALYLKHILQEEHFDKAPIFILQADTPGYVQRAFEFFCIEFICEANDIKGQVLDVQLTPPTSIRTVAKDWIEKFATQTPNYSQLLEESTDLPKKAFISRRKTREISNEQEVESFLAEKGYQKIYPEDLSPIEQIKLFVQATDIVAIHGAAMGPLTYRPSQQPPLKLVEIFSPGHMSEFYRAISYQIGTHWVGVRGKLRKEHIDICYQLDKPYKKYSLSNFEVDLVSLQTALLHISTTAGNSAS